jgi:hypothetical protein
MKKLFLLLVPSLLFAQNPPPQPAAPKPAAQLGSATNNQGFTQSKSFSPPKPPKQGGSMVKANPFLTTADFAFLGNPTFEGGYRSGLSLGTSKTNDLGTRGMGGNALLTTDFTQRGVTVYRSIISNGKSVYFAASFAQIGTNETHGVSITQVRNKDNWNMGEVLNLSFGNGEDFRIFSPTVAFFINKSIVVNDRLDMTLEVFNNISNYYYDRDAKQWDKDLTVNILTGSEIGYQVTKRFVLNVDWRVNINTNPNWGVMHNFLIGSNFKF